jgi:hypothetical protein
VKRFFVVVDNKLDRLSLSVIASLHLVWAAGFNIVVLVNNIFSVINAPAYFTRAQNTT